MIVTPYVAKSTGIKFGKIYLSPPSRRRGVRGLRYLKEITEMQSLRKLILILQVEPSEIGIISPYRRQVQKIRDLMNRKFQNKYRDWKNITVGSTEEFQGENMFQKM